MEKSDPPGIFSPKLSRMKKMARKASVAGEQSVYEDDLDQFVMKEYFRFVPALAHHHFVRKGQTFVKEGAKRDVHFMEKHFVAAVLVDISGFTRISTEIGAENTKKHCNAFFSRLLQVIATFRGDTLKFLGDAVLVLWALDHDASELERANSCRVCLECAVALMKVGDYDAQDIHQTTDEPYPVTLRLHCGLACGPANLFCVGRMERSEMLLGGNILNQLATCEAEAKRREVIMSKIFEHELGDIVVPWPVQATPKGNFMIVWEDQGIKKNIDVDVETRRTLQTKKSSKLIKRISVSLGFSSVLSDEEEDSSSTVGSSNASERMTVSDWDMLGSNMNPTKELIEMDDDATTTTTTTNETHDGKRKTVVYSRDGYDRVKTMLHLSNICVDSQQKQYKLFHRDQHEHNDEDTDKRNAKARRRRRRNSLAHRFKLRSLRALQREYREQLKGQKEKKNEEVTLNKSVRWRMRSLIHRTGREIVDNDMVGQVGDLCHITTLFIQLDELIPSLQNGDLDHIQSAFLVLLETVESAGGVLRQFVQDDKGCVGIAIFGAPGMPHSHVEDRALRCGFGLIKAFKDVKVSSCGIGIATGDVFCGFVGAHHRCEWAVMGPSVNLAARLMGKAPVGTILIDDETYSKTHNSNEFSFLKCEPIVAKGYEKPVRVHSPTSSLDILSPEMGGEGGSKGTQVRKRKLGRINSTTELIPMEQIQLIRALPTFDLMILKLASAAAYSESSEQDYFDSRVLYYILRSLGHQDSVRILRALRRLVQEDRLLRVVVREKRRTVLNASAKEDNKDDIAIHDLENINSKDKKCCTVLNALMRHFIFQKLSPNLMDYLVVTSTIVELEEDEKLYKQGDVSNEIYVLESGTFSVYIDEVDDTHDQQKSDSNKSGTLVGVIASLFEQPRAATIIANEKCVFYKLDSSAISTIMYRLEFQFWASAIRKSVYGLVLQKHRKKYHGVIARYLLLQQDTIRKQAMNRTLSQMQRQAIQKKLSGHTPSTAKSWTEHLDEKESSPDLNSSPKNSTDEAKKKEDVIVQYKEKICEHMVLSDLSLVTKVTHIKNYARMVATKGMNDSALRWYTHLLRIALSIDVYQNDLFQGFYIDSSSNNNMNNSNKVVPQNMKLEEHPTRTQLLNQKVLKIMVPSKGFTAIVSQITSSSEPGKGSAILLSGWFIELGNVYISSAKYILAFNVAQIVLMYMEATTIPVRTINRIKVVCFGGSMYTRWKRCHVRKVLEKMSSSEIHIIRKAYRLASNALYHMLQVTNISCEQIYRWTQMAVNESNTSYKIARKRSRSFSPPGGLSSRSSSISREDTIKSTISSSSEYSSTPTTPTKKKKRNVGHNYKKARITFRPV